tara:strand:+ start:181 stop:915 length:735 start_codon:yes stop_codon:yes gene_type:complete
MSKKVLILGGNSDIGIAIAENFMLKGYDVQLATRNTQKQNVNASNFKLRYEKKVQIYEFDILNNHNHKSFIENLSGLPDIVICVVGYMGKQDINEINLEERTLVMKTNYEGPVNILSEFANLYEKEGYGMIVGVSSVAGERGRGSNYIYGASKSGFTSFLSGLRNRLAKKNVHVVTVLPGPVETKMTQHLNLPKFLTSSTEEVAKKVYHAVINRKDIIYVKSIWKYLIFIIKIIPEKIFKNLNL